MADQFLQGDARGIDPGLYRIPLTIDQAQGLVDLLRAELRTLPVTVLRGRKTRRRHGHARGPIDWAYARGWVITLHPIGLNLGALLHEFAHVASPTRGHGAAFKATQRQVIRAFHALPGSGVEGRLAVHLTPVV